MLCIDICVRLFRVDLHCCGVSSIANHAHRCMQHDRDLGDAECTVSLLGRRRRRRRRRLGMTHRVTLDMRGHWRGDDRSRRRVGIRIGLRNDRLRLLLGLLRSLRLIRLGPPGEVLLDLVRVLRVPQVIKRKCIDLFVVVKVAEVAVPNILVAHDNLLEAGRNRAVPRLIELVVATLDDRLDLAVAGCDLVVPGLLRGLLFADADHFGAVAKQEGVLRVRYLFDLLHLDDNLDGFHLDRLSRDRRWRIGRRVDWYRLCRCYLGRCLLDMRRLVRSRFDRFLCRVLVDRWRRGRHAMVVGLFLVCRHASVEVVKGEVDGCIRMFVL